MNIAVIGLDAAFTTIPGMRHLHITCVAVSLEPLGGKEISGYIAGVGFNVYSARVTVIHFHTACIGEYL